MTEVDLILYIKRQLGFGVVNLEITDEQIKDCIRNAVDEISPYYSIFKYITLDVTGTCVDLTPFNVQDVTDVIKVFSNVEGQISNTNENIIKTDTGNNSSISTSNLFSYSPSSMPPGSIYPMAAMMSYPLQNFGNTNIHQVMSSYAQLYNEQFYSMLAQQMQQRAAGALYENISWKYNDNKLYVDTGYPHTNVITIEYIPNTIIPEDFDPNTRYIKYLRDLSVAYCLLLQARITGKYTVQGSPVTINSAEMRADAQAELTRIREELVTTANRFYITD